MAIADGSSRKPPARNLFLAPFDLLPDTLLLRIMSFMPHAKSLGSLRLTCKRLQDLGARNDALAFHARDFEPSGGQSAEKAVTRVVLHSANLRRLYVEIPPRTPKLQELAVLAWCLHCRGTLEELTLIDAPHDPRAEPQSEEWKLEHASECRRLRRLELHNVCLDYQQGLSCSRFGRLQHLLLRQVSLIGELLEDLLRQCPVLEELQLLACSGLGPLDLVGTPCVRLRRFELVVSDMAEEASLELLRLNAPNLESLVLVVDCFPQAASDASLESALWGSIHISSGRLQELHLDLTAPFNLRVNPEAVTGLQKLQVLGDEWPWAAVEELLEMCGPHLEVLNVGASFALPPFLSPLHFFARMPSLQYLSMGPEMFDLLCRSLGSADTVQCACLREIHVEYLAHSIDEARLASALLRGCPQLRKLQPIYNVAQVRGSGGQSDEEYRVAMAKLREEYPHVVLPT